METTVESTVTADEIAHQEKTILENDLGRSMNVIDRFMEDSRFATTAIYAIGVWLGENGDEAGQLLVTEFAKRFAKHEATTL